MSKIKEKTAIKTSETLEFQETETWPLYLTYKIKLNPFI